MKNSIRILSLILVLVLSLTMASVAALADFPIISEAVDTSTPSSSQSESEIKPRHLPGLESGESREDDPEDDAPTGGPVVYDIYGQPVIDPADDATFTCKASYDKFVGIEMDGESVDGENFTVVRGSTIVTFSSKYLSSLPEGKHTVKFIYTDGFGKMNFTSKKNASEGNPKTGVETLGGIATVLIVTAACGAVAVSSKKKG